MKIWIIENTPFLREFLPFMRPKSATELIWRASAITAFYAVNAYRNTVADATHPKTKQQKYIVDQLVALHLQVENVSDKTIPLFVSYKHGWATRTQRIP